MASSAALRCGVVLRVCVLLLSLGPLASCGRPLLWSFLALLLFAVCRLVALFAVLGWELRGFLRSPLPAVLAVCCVSAFAALLPACWCCLVCCGLAVALLVLLLVLGLLVGAPSSAFAALGWLCCGGVAYQK